MCACVNGSKLAHYANAILQFGSLLLASAFNHVMLIGCSWNVARFARELKSFGRAHKMCVHTRTKPKHLIAKARAHGRDNCVFVCCESFVWVYVCVRVFNMCTYNYSNILSYRHAHVCVCRVQIALCCVLLVCPECL